MSTKPLFRREAVDARRHGHLGSVTTKLPHIYTLLATGTVAAVVILSIMAAHLSWTRRETIQGHLKFDKGIIKIYASQSGILETSYISVGDRVFLGQPLFSIFTDRKFATNDNFQDSVSKLVMQRERSLMDEKWQLEIIGRSDALAIDEKIAMLEISLHQAEEQLKGQEKRVAIFAQSLTKYEELVKDGFFSSEALNLRTADVLDAKDRLLSIRRELGSTAGQKRELVLQKYALPKKALTQAIQLNRAILNMRQELAESVNKASYKITAPQTGTVTQILFEHGDTVDQSKVIADLVPDGAKLQLLLFASDKQVGLITPGKQVSIQIEAFPYQKFGVIHGVIVSIPVTPSTPKELKVATMDAMTSNGSDQAMFPLIVELDTQVFYVNGQLVPLRAGMVAKAIVDQDQRKIYEWLLEPLISLKASI